MKRGSESSLIVGLFFKFIAAGVFTPEVIFPEPMGRNGIPSDKVQNFSAKNLTKEGTSF